MPEDTKPDEPKYKDPETGKPIIYADNVPEILRGLTEENCGFELDDPKFVKMDTKMSVVQRAEQGVVLWNRWVQWAELRDQRWLTYQVCDDQIYICLKNGINDQPVIKFDSPSGGRLFLNFKNFANFVFPCRTDFTNVTFQERVTFQSAFFSRDVFFCGAIFQLGAIFSEAKFAKAADFRGGEFRELVSIIQDAHFAGYSDFGQVVFKTGVQFVGSDFLSAADFEGVTFNGTCDFSRCEFFDELFCKKAIFCDSVIAESAHFHQMADFGGSGFGRSVKFGNSCFFAKATFVNCDFKGQVDLDWAHFAPALNTPHHESETVPNFSGAKFAVPPNLGYTEISAPKLRPSKNHWDKVKRFWGSGVEAARIADEKATSKLRRLQELAADGHHHLAEKRFFRAELLCRRGHEAKEWPEIMMINLFELFSMCGLSFRRPIAWWLGLFAVFFAVYGGFAGLFEAGWSVEDSFHLVNYTFSNATPVLGVIKASDSAAVQALFNGGQPPWVTLLAGVHNLISTIFLFFALLAIRNYFKLG